MVIRHQQGRYLRRPEVGVLLGPFVAMLMDRAREQTLRFMQTCHAMVERSKAWAYRNMPEEPPRGALPAPVTEKSWGEVLAKLDWEEPIKGN